MKLLSLLAFLFSLTLNFNCVDKSEFNATEMKAAEMIKTLNTADTFLFEFPKENDRFDSITFSQMKHAEEKSLKIASLEKGFDSIQIRISYGCAIEGERFVTLIHNRKNWKAEISNIGKYYSESSGTYDSLTRDIKYRKPKSGWVKFIGKLFDLKILSLPDDNKIPGFQPAQPMDGCGILFEIATKKVYRCYGYENPDLQVDKHWQAKNALLIIKLLSDEFKISEWPVWPEDMKEKRESGPTKLDIKATELQDIDTPQKKNKKQ